MNMDYCKFENTLLALRQCASGWDEEVKGSESKAKSAMIELMAELLEESGHEVIEPDGSEYCPDGREMTAFYA